MEVTRVATLFVRPLDLDFVVNSILAPLTFFQPPTVVLAAVIDMVIAMYTPRMAFLKLMQTKQNAVLRQ